MFHGRTVFSCGGLYSEYQPDKHLEDLDEATFTSRFHRRAFSKMLGTRSEWPSSVAAHLVKLLFVNRQPAGRLLWRRKLWSKQ